MDNEMRTLLEDEIKSEIKKLSQYETGTAQHTAAVESVTKLYRVNIEDVEKERAFTSQTEQDVDRQRELQLKVAQLEEQKIDRYFKFGAEVGVATLTLLFYGIWMRRGFKFEENGTYTSKTFMNLINRFRPTTR